MAHTSYKLYLDDSGTKEYSSTGTYAPNGGPTRYFVFAGVMLVPRVAGELERKLKDLKTATFGTSAVEIKANWLKRPLERQRRFIEKYKVSESQLTEFVDATYDMIATSDLSLVGCIVDKVAVTEKYAERRYYAPAIAYDCLMQRVQKEMTRRTGTIHVTIDDMAGATPGGNQYKINLLRQHERLRTRGSSLQPGTSFDRLEGMSFSNSAADERHQLADLVAYSLYRQFVDHGEQWDAAAETLPTYDYFARIGQQFCNNDGTITGYGIVKFPRTSAQRWGIKKP